VENFLQEDKRNGFKMSSEADYALRRISEDIQAQEDIDAVVDGLVVRIEFLILLPKHGSRNGMLHKLKGTN